MSAEDNIRSRLGSEHRIHEHRHSSASTTTSSTATTTATTDTRAAAGTGAITTNTPPGLEVNARTGAPTTVFTKGRPPWFKASGERADALVIGITGGSASGKTTVARAIIDALGVPWVCLLSMDSFYRVLSPAESARAYANEYDFDHPEAFDTDLLVETLAALKRGQPVNVPVYDFSTHARRPDSESVRMYGANIVIFEGILNFVDARLRALMDIKIFVDTDADIRLARRLRRDIAERGRDLAGALQQYRTFVKPSFDQFIQPCMQYADLVMPRGATNVVAMDLIVRHVQAQMAARGHDLRRLLESQRAAFKARRPASLHVLPQTKQLIGLHTIIRNRETQRDAFIFYADRIMRLVTEHALTLMPYEDVIVATVSGSSSGSGSGNDSSSSSSCCSSSKGSDSGSGSGNGNTFLGKRRMKKLAAVSVMRAGLTMESAVRSVLGAVPLGKVLIQTNAETLNPELHYCKVPRDLSGRCVLVLDATVSSGAAALMAIRVLLDHGVSEADIYFLTLITSPKGAATIAYAFPKVTIVASAVDNGTDHNNHLLPGIGNFGNRYFGTEEK